jgi:hypothetical protein
VKDSVIDKVFFVYSSLVLLSFHLKGPLERVGGRVGGAVLFFVFAVSLVVGIISGSIKQLREKDRQRGRRQPPAGWTRLYALFGAMAANAWPATIQGMSSLYLIPKVGPLEIPVVRPAGLSAAEAFDDEPFSMNLTVDEAAAASTSEAAVDGDRWAWAS